MKANIIHIGNSLGIRIPKPVIKQCGFENEVELEVHEHKLIIRTTHQPRRNWDDDFARMAHNKDDEPIISIAEPTSQWDEQEWEW